VARLEYIRLPLERILIEDDSLLFEPDEVVDPRSRLLTPVLIERVPQIIWSSGEAWSEANLWLLRRARLLLSGKLKTDTVGANGKDLAAYANWLELSGRKWWQCPIRDDERPLNLYRGFLVSSCGPETPGRTAGDDEGTNSSTLSPLLASRRMSTARAFYQWLLAEEILSPGFPLWSEKKVSIPYEDALGFKRHVETVQMNRPGFSGGCFR
jgi:hypothetical protein